MKKSLVILSALLTGTVLAAPAKRDPVAAGFPDWEVKPAQHLYGAEITASDLRQRITIVVEFEGKDLGKELEPIGLIQEVMDVPLGTQGEWLDVNWTGLEWPRKVKILYNHSGATSLKAESFDELFAKKYESKTAPGLCAIKKNKPSIYSGVKFEGGPDTQGKLPFVYVMGETGTTPIWSEPFKGKSTIDALKKVLKEAIGKLPEWQDFHGSVLEPTVYKAQLSKAISAKKGFTALLPVLKKGIASKNEATGKEAQIIYDAIMQYRGDLSYRILLEAQKSPPRAIYDGNELVRWFPADKKAVALSLTEARKDPESDAMAKILAQVMEWSDPEFTCKNAGEAKRNVATLEKFKKSLTTYSESKSKRIQDAAFLIQAKVEELIATMPNCVK